MDFPKKQAQRLMPLYLLEYSEKLFTNHPDPSAPWGGGGGGSDYTAGEGITITNNEISVDTNVIPTKSDISTYYVTLDTSQTITGFKWFTDAIFINSSDNAGKLDLNYDALFFNNFNTKESFSIFPYKGIDGPGFCFSIGEENPTINYYMFPHLDLPGEHRYTLATTDDITTSLNGYATKTWVQNQGYITNAALNNYVTTTQLTDSLYDYALKTEIPTEVSQLTNDAGYATQTWVENKGYATQTWVENKGYATSSSLATVATTGNYNDLTNKPTIPTYSLRKTTTPVLNSVTLSKFYETLTFTYSDNTTASFNFLTADTEMVNNEVSVINSVSLTSN